MKRKLLIVLLSVFALYQAQAQTDKFWTSRKGGSEVISKTNIREDFPQEFQLYDLNVDALRNVLFTAKDRFAAKKGVLITIPNADGQLEQFEVFEASNFTPEFQSQFPNIRAYAGKSLTDKFAVLRLSIAPEGIQTMVMRTDKPSEFLEVYSQNGTTYAFHKSTRINGKLPFMCSTQDKALATSIMSKAPKVAAAKSDSEEYLTFRLALSCTGEYATTIGGGVAGVVAQFNATMARVNGVFEKDFAIHMNIIGTNNLVIYTNAATDPYGSTDANYNSELQATLTGVIGDANYDVGHLLSSVGGVTGNGNAGCIGCVCDAGKGSGFTTRSVPTGDAFDIDFVAHEMGHQFGANHTFSMSNEGTGVNMEPGSGSTIMGYAGITPQDVQPNSDAYFHYASIFQVQSNMETKTCPTRTSMTNNAPVANAGLNYTIPRSTPFILTGTGTDVDGNALTYCWEQIDSALSTQTGAASAATIAKASGPNWRSYNPTAVNFRYFPRIQSVIANSATTAGTEINVEALSSVSRTLNFALTVRDNVALNGQTSTDAMVVTVNAAAGPFAVTAPNTAVSWAVGTNQTVTWNVAGTTANNVNASHVDILLSTDGGNTYPIVLASEVPNDGTETITVPNNIGTTNRVMIRGYNHIFFDISNANFTIAAPASSFSLAYGGTPADQNIPICQGASASYTFQYTPLSGFAGTTTFSSTGQPAGTTVTFTPTSRTTAGTVVMNVTNTAAALVNTYTINVVGTSGATTRNSNVYLNVLSPAFGTQNLTAPANLAVGQATTTTISWPANAAATSYDVQVATDLAFTTIVASGTVTGTSTSISGLLESTNYYWRVMPKNLGCSGTFSSPFRFTTGQSNCTYNYSNNTVINVADGTGANTPGATATKTISVSGLTGSINAVSVGVSMAHTYVQDLVVELVHPDGTIIRLMNRNCDEGATIAGATYSFNFTNSAASQLPSGSCLTPAPITGNVRPVDPITNLNGKTGNGTWTLRATDYYNGDIGSVSDWSINLCVAEPSLARDTFNDFTDLSLSPNPSNGNFNVKFTSEASNDIKINVHDLRGRQVYEKNFSNSGDFNQNINLENVQSGVYLVTISNGVKKTVKKIIIE